MKIKANQVRGVIYMQNGQPCETWLPAGVYAVGGIVWLAAGRERQGESVQAVEMFRHMGAGKPERWYTADPACMAQSVEVIP